MPGNSDLVRRFAALAAMGFEPVEEGSVSRDLVPVGRRFFRVVHSRPAMGTLVSVSALVGSPDRADHAAGLAFEEMDRLIGIFSHYDGRSAASQLNQLGRLDGPPPELVQVAADAERCHRLTRGRFDISVAPLVELFRHRPHGALPDDADLRAALELVGAEQIEISRRRIGLRRLGMRVTLDGIAKGFIVDAMARVLERNRIRNYLVEAGGDIRARGSRGQGRPWRVAVQDPEKGPDFPDTIELSRGAVATSGSYERYYDPDREHHHIFSAETGRSPQQSRSATVVAPTAMAADALATSVFLMAPRAGVRLVDRLRGCECLVIDREGAQLRTKGWSSAGPT
jgi:thiamine biosynthesis lipoprotein